jgi:hypothetical protein
MHTSCLQTIVLSMLILTLFPDQSTGQPAISFGLKAGLNRTSQHQVFPGFQDLLESRTGFDIGIFGEWRSNPWLSLSSEVHFARKVTADPDIPVTNAESPAGTGEFIKTSFLFDYVSISILPKICTSFGPVEVYGLFGPRIDISVHRAAHVEAPERFTSAIEQIYNPYLSHFKDTQVGGDFAVGCQLAGPVFSGIGLEVRFSPDFMTSYEYAGGTITNRSWEFLVVVTL